MKQLGSLSKIDWIAGVLRSRTSETSCTVAHCVPPIFPAYAKIFHPIYEDLAVRDHELTWQKEDVKSRALSVDAPKTEVAAIIQAAIERSTLVYGGVQPESRPVRLRWVELARRLNLPFVPTLSSRSFTRQFAGGSWPRRLIGPEEGNLAGSDRDALASILRRHTDVDRCLFHVWLLATEEWNDLLFEGILDDALLFPEKVPGVRFTPTHWFPEDRTWFVCTDYDLTFTLVGGSKGLVDELMRSHVLECVPVSPETRIDYKADLDGIIQQQA